MKTEKVTSFWEGERCECCGGEIMEKKVDLHRKTRGKHILIENVPAGVCTNCGARYFAANVLKSIDQAVHGRRKAARRVQVPVYSV